MKKEVSENHIHKVRHSLSHILATAVLEKFPTAKLGIGPVIERGFYYDFDLPSPLSEKDLHSIEKRMKQLIQEHLVFQKKSTTPAAIKKILSSQPYKHELIAELTREKKPLSLYETYRKKGTKKDIVFIDLCAGPHVKNTKEIDPQAFTLTHLAGAYWKGDEKNAMLTRIYGVAFATKKELDTHLALLEEAKKRDHKKLGVELDLFTFSPLVGAGLPLWTPRGTLVRNLLDDFVWELRREKGYEKIDIPHITKKDLYETSGHWDKFKDELFKIETREGHLFALKPMNCPHHTQIYARKRHSYRDLPQRYANTTMVYRDEQSGELAGLSRVRCITQDDAHVFCRYDQIKEEMGNIWDIIDTFYTSFGFDLSVRLSLGDPRHPEKYLGDQALWKKSEKALRELVTSRVGKNYYEAIGEAAFYGPKIDFIAKDSLQREWQVATIQLDMNMPQRFSLGYINEKGKEERVAMIHAAIMGSIERFLSVLIEHLAGAFPLWLSPVQIALIPISEKHAAYTKSIRKTLEKEGFRVLNLDSGETLGKRIRLAEMQKIPYSVIIGDAEKKNKTLNLRKYKKGTLGELSLEKTVEKLNKEAKKR